MKAIADALVYAVAFIDLREDEAEKFLDDDVDALESIAGYLAHASAAELDELAAAADRAHAAEASMPSPRAPFLESYAQWMENMFGDEWVGNRRASESKGIQHATELAVARSSAGAPRRRGVRWKDDSNWKRLTGDAADRVLFPSPGVHARERLG